MLISNGISHSGGFAYHLHKPFPPANGKPLFPHCLIKKKSAVIKWQTAFPG